MPKIKKPIKPNSFIDCEDIEENTAVYNFNNNTLRLGKVNLNPKQLERISLLLAHDLKVFAKINSNFSTLFANAVYTYLQNDQSRLRCYGQDLQIWDASQPLPNREYETLYSLIQNGLKTIDISQFEELNKYGEYPIDFLYVLMQLLSTQEKNQQTGCLYVWANYR